MQTLGERLKEERKKRGITQSAMAEILGLTRSAYSLYESGRREPNITTLKNIATKLNTSTDDMLGKPSKDKLNKFGDFITANQIRYTICKVNGVSGKMFALDQYSAFEYFLTDEQARQLPEMSVEQIKALIRSFDRQNKEEYNE